MGDRSAVAGGPAARRVPAVAKLGALTVVVGLLWDLVEHATLSLPAASFSAAEHAAHLVVLIGMVLVLAAVAVDGARSSGRHGRSNRSRHHAIR
jgi:hypothetical protein